MSRTIRRKNALYKRKYYISDIEEFNNLYYKKRYHGMTPEQIIKKQKSKFHSDHEYILHVPSFLEDI